MGVKNPIVLDVSSTCDSISGLDISHIKVPESMIMPSEVKNLIVCRFTDKRQFMVMEARSNFILMSDKKIAYATKSEGRLSQSKNSLKLKLDAPEIKMELHMKKKKDMTIEGRVSHKTTVDLSMPDLYVKEIGACHEL
jgi:hypothetical protein